MNRDRAGFRRVCNTGRGERGLSSAGVNVARILSRSAASTGRS